LAAGAWGGRGWSNGGLGDGGLGGGWQRGYLPMALRSAGAGWSTNANSPDAFATGLFSSLG
jgi:hypothetical protein